MFGLLVETMHYVSGACGGQGRQWNPLRLELELGTKEGLVEGELVLLLTTRLSNCQ